MPQNSSTTYFAASFADWQVAKSYSSIVQGAGPFLVAFEAIDTGGNSRLSAAVLVDGSPYTLAGALNTTMRLKLIRNSTEAAAVPANWLSSTSFNDSSWSRATGESSDGTGYHIGSLSDSVALLAGVSSMRSVWAPNIYTTFVSNYARVVIIPPSCSK